MYRVGASVNWPLKYARDARWDVMSRIMQVLETMFVRKKNDDGMHTVLASGVSRNTIIYDSQVTAGLFSKRLVSLMMMYMRRSAGGNTGSNKRGRLTDLFMSPEAKADILSWDLTMVDDATRNKIHNSANGDGLSSIYGVRLHDLDELGVGQEYQQYFAGELTGTLPTDKQEILIGLDLSQRDGSFVRPMTGNLEVYDDPTFHRRSEASAYSWLNLGYGALNNLRTLVAAI